MKKQSYLFFDRINRIFALLSLSLISLIPTLCVGMQPEKTSPIFLLAPQSQAVQTRQNLPLPLYVKELIKELKITPKLVERIRKTHFVIVDDVEANLEVYRNIYLRSGLADLEHLHLFSQVDEALKEMKWLRDTQKIPDEEILILTDLAFGLNEDGTLKRDGFDLVSEVRLSGESPAQGYRFKLGSKARILVISGSMPTKDAMPNLLDQEAKEYDFDYIEKGAKGDFSDNLVRAILKISKRSPAISGPILNPILKSDKWKLASIRKENWAVFNSFEAEMKGLISQLKKALETAPESENKLLAERNLTEFNDLLHEPYPDGKKLHDFNNRVTRFSEFIRAAQVNISRIQGGGVDQQELLDLLQELRMSLEKIKKFAQWVQGFDFFLDYIGARSPLREALNKAVEIDRIQGRFVYNDAHRTPTEALAPEVLDLEVSYSLAFVIRVILENALDAYEAREMAHSHAERGSEETWRTRPIEIQVQTEQDDEEQRTKIILTDEAGGIQGFSDLGEIFQERKGTRVDQPGYGLWWARYLANQCGFDLEVENVQTTRFTGTRTIITLKKRFAVQLEKDQRAPFVYQPKNEKEEALQRESKVSGGKIAGWERLDRASGDVGIKVPAWEAMESAQLWGPFIRHNSALKEKGDRILEYYQALVNFLYQQAAGVNDTETFLKDLEDPAFSRVKEQLAIENFSDLFEEDFRLDSLKDEEGRFSKERIAGQVDEYLKKLSFQFTMPQELVRSIEEKTQNLLAKIEARGEEFMGVF